MGSDQNHPLTLRQRLDHYLTGMNPANFSQHQPGRPQPRHPHFTQSAAGLSQAFMHQSILRLLA